MKRKIKRGITLLEIMIVVLLIGIIGSVLGFNMKGSLEEGKAFKSREGAKQIRDVLLMEVAEGTDLQEVVQDPEKYLKKSPLVNNAGKLLQDGWGKKYDIVAKDDIEDIEVTSSNLKAYEERKKRD